MASQNHKIKRQTVELSLSDESKAHPLMELFRKLTHEYFLPELERKFDLMVGNDQVLRVEQMELDLGLIHSENIVEEAKAKFQRALLDADIQLISKRGGNENGGGVGTAETAQQRISKGERDLQRLRHYLRHGFCDWSSNGGDFPGISKTIDQLFAVNPKAFIQMAVEIGNLPGVARRLVNRLSEDQIESLLESILGSEYENYTDFLLMLSEWFLSIPSTKPRVIQRIGRELGVRTGARGTPFQLWSKVFFTHCWRSLAQETDHGFEYLVDAFSTWRNERTIPGSPFWGERLESWILDLSSQLKNGKKDISGGDVDAPNSIPGSSPFLGSGPKEEDEGKQTGENHRGEIDSQSNKLSPMGQASKSKRIPGSPTPKSSPSTPHSEFYLKNAGMVLLWPFFQGALRDLGFLNTGNVFQKDSFKERAALWLQFMITGLEDLPEEELVLNKILVGLPLEFPIVAQLVPTEDEKKVAERTLRSAITHWKALRNMSTDGFRGSYLLRPGILRWKAPLWRLMVEGRPYDMLMAQMPWGISLIRLPWLDEMMEVQWK